jgi:hypothetical protein
MSVNVRFGSQAASQHHIRRAAGNGHKQPFPTRTNSSSERLEDLDTVRADANVNPLSDQPFGDRLLEFAQREDAVISKPCQDPEFNENG